jgi:hypothetical protein
MFPSPDLAQGLIWSAGHSQKGRCHIHGVDPNLRGIFHMVKDSVLLFIFFPQAKKTYGQTGKDQKYKSPANRTTARITRLTQCNMAGWQKQKGGKDHGKSKGLIFHEDNG